MPETYKQRRSRALKAKHEQLDMIEPFSQQERKGLGKSNMAFIRDIQISRRISKDEALKLYGESNLKGKETLKELMSATKQKIHDYYNQKHKFQVVSAQEFEEPIQKERNKRLKEEEKIRKNWLKEQKKELRFYLASVKNRNSKIYPKIKRDHKIYPDATKFELSKGVNSKAAKEFRVKHGFSPEYSGKVVKNAKNK
jgi:hypothetical protein